jgi:hypothetical protein
MQLIVLFQYIVLEETKHFILIEPYNKVKDEPLIY